MCGIVQRKSLLSTPAQASCGVSETGGLRSFRGNSSRMWTSSPSPASLHHLSLQRWAEKTHLRPIPLHLAQGGRREKTQKGLRFHPVVGRLGGGESQFHHVDLKMPKEGLSCEQKVCFMGCPKRLFGSPTEIDRKIQSLSKCWRTVPLHSDSPTWKWKSSCS